MDTTNDIPIVEASTNVLPVGPSRRAAGFWNLGFGYGAVVIALVQSFLLVPLFLHYIGIREYGAWLATGGVLAYLTVVDFGIVGAVGQQAAESFGARDRRRLEDVLGTGLLIAGALSLGPIFVGLGLARFLPHLFGIVGPAAAQLQAAFIIVAAASGGNLAANAIDGVLKGLQRTFIAGVIGLCAELAGIATTVVVLLRGWGLFSIAAGQVVRTAILGVGGGVALAWVCIARLNMRPRWSRRTARRLWPLSMYQFGAAAVGKLQGAADPFIVGVLMGPAQAALYAITVRAIATVRLFCGQLAISATPGMAHLFGEGSRARLKIVISSILRAQSVVAAIGFGGCIVFNGTFVRLWVGKELFGGTQLTMWACVAGVTYLAVAVAYQSLWAMGDMKKLLLYNGVAAITRLPLLVVLVRLIGLPGAPLAEVVAAGPAGWLLGRRVVEALAMSRAELWRIVVDAARVFIPVLLGSALFIAALRSNAYLTWTGFLIVGVGFTVIAAGGICLMFGRHIRDLISLR